MTQESLKERLRYEPETGVFTHRNVPKHSKNKVGGVVSSITPIGYLNVQLDGRKYIAWI